MSNFPHSLFAWCHKVYSIVVKLIIVFFKTVILIDISGYLENFFIWLDFSKQLWEQAPLSEYPAIPSATKKRALFTSGRAKQVSPIFYTAVTGKPYSYTWNKIETYFKVACTVTECIYSTSTATN